jgi:hypothetical protein
MLPQGRRGRQAFAHDNPFNAHRTRHVYVFGVNSSVSKLDISELRQQPDKRRYQCREHIVFGYPVGLTLGRIQKLLSRGLFKHKRKFLPALQRPVDDAGVDQIQDVLVFIERLVGTNVRDPRHSLAITQQGKLFSRLPAITRFVGARTGTGEGGAFLVRKNFGILPYHKFAVGSHTADNGIVTRLQSLLGLLGDDLFFSAIRLFRILCHALPYSYNSFNRGFFSSIYGLLDIFIYYVNIMWSEVTGLDKQKAVIFVCADEAQFGGERDYMKALAADINARGQRKDTAYFFCKQGSGGTNNPEAMPLSNADYAAIPSPDRLPLHDIAGMASVEIVAVGHSTLKAATSLPSLITGGSNTPSVSLGYITHMIKDSADLKYITDRNMTVFSSASREEIAALDAKLAAKVNLVQLAAVPHTNTQASCKVNYDAYMKTVSGQEVAQFVSEKQPFAFAVLNAGFSVDGEHVPYTEKEARKHGAALGHHLPAGTHLILAHGGPRNLLDEQAGQNTVDAFAAAYQSAQAERHAQPKIIRERYAAGLPYDIIKAGYLLSHASNCQAFVSNSEGYGTMDGAALQVDNRKQLLGMFPFQALYADATGQRQANIEKYNQKGVAVLKAEKGKLVIEKYPQQTATPRSSEDAASRIVSALSLAAPVSATVKARPAPQA